MELACEMQITKVAVKSKLIDSQVVRKMTVQLTREFDVLLAKAIGGDGLKILQALETGGLEKAIMPIDEVVASLALHVVVAGESVDNPRTDKVFVPRTFGKKARATAAKTEDTSPSIALEFEFLFDGAAWAWFGRNVGGFATIEIEPSQLKLATARVG
jgi:hypothetical protein